MRKRAAETDAGRTGEVFTLPDDEATAAAGAAVKPKAEATTAKAEPVSKDAQALQVGRAAPVVIVAELAGPKPAETIQGAPAGALPAQTGASALLAAAIAAQAGTPTKTDADKAGDNKDAVETGDEAASTVVDPGALMVLVPLPVDAKAGLVVLPTELSAAAISALPGMVLPVPGSAILAVDAPVPPAAVAPGAGAVISLAAAAGKPAPQQGGLVGAPDGSEVEGAASRDAAKAESTAAGHPSLHLAKATGTEPASPLKPQDAKQPDIDLTEALQPLQGAIDLSALMQGRPAKPDGALALMTPEQAAAAQSGNAQGQSATGGPPTPLHVVPIEIGLRALAGGRNFDIRLDPAELGRVDVSLKISDSGEVTAKLVVDRVETLHMLQRDARTLERAFEQAGLKPSNAGVDITLRDPADQSGFRQNRQHDEAPRRTPTITDAGEDIGISAQPVQSTPIRGLLRLGGVDLSI